jgi:hypothetical protein
VRKYSWGIEFNLLHYIKVFRISPNRKSINKQNRSGEMVTRAVIVLSIIFFVSPAKGKFIILRSAK